MDIPETARVALARLETTPSIVAATVFSRRSGSPEKPFAQFVRKGVQVHFGSTPRPDGFVTEGNRILHVSTTLLEGVPLATLQIEGDLSAARREWSQSLRWLAVVFAVLLVIGWWLARS